MSEQKADASWWQTLPGLLTGLAAVLTAAGGIIAVLHRGDGAANDPPGAATAAAQEGRADPAPSAVAPPRAERQARQTGVVRAGHYRFKLLNTELSPYASDTGGRPHKLALRLHMRVTDVMGMSDYVDRRTIRLAVDGAQLLPENSINVAVYDRSSVEIEALFIVPADASSATLLLGREEDSVGTLPLQLSAIAPPPGKTAG